MEGLLLAVEPAPRQSATEHGHSWHADLGDEGREASLPAASGRQRILGQRRNRPDRLLGAATPHTRRRGRAQWRWRPRNLVKR